MSFTLQRPRWCVRVPNKFEDIICTLNQKNNSQIGDNDEQLENDKINEGIKEIGVNDESKAFDDGEKEVMRIGESNKSYAKQVTIGDCVDNKLNHIPTLINENGQEFVIFNDEIISKGSRKWELAACGYFIGYRMSIQELRYHIYRMWSKFGLRHILNNGNGVFVFIFDNQQGLQTVIESDLWIVNNKPMVVQKWNPPLEAWSIKGLSTLASRIGKPLIMDAMTTKMCNQGISRLGYARVLVEVNAKKGLEDHIDVLYKNSNSGEQFVKKEKIEEQVLEHAKANANMNNVEGRKVNEGKRYMQQNRKPVEKKYEAQKFIYRKKNKEGDKDVVKNINKSDCPKNYKTPQHPQRKIWNVNERVIKDVRSTSNTYAILQDMEEDFVLTKLNTKEKQEVEKQQSKEKENVEVGTNDDTDIELDENGVYINKSGTARFMTDNEVSGMGSDLLTKLLETHMKKNRIDKVCMNVFGSWYWQTNVGLSRKGCRLAVGWDNNHVNCTLMNSTEQSMVYMVEVLNHKRSFYCTFIYAANKGKDRRELWKELNLNKRIVGNSAWIIMGDVNVSLNLKDHSEVMSNNLFLTKFNNAHALFLPYGISDHSPAILKIPQVLTKKKKSFRPANYITDKEEFKILVKENRRWRYKLKAKLHSVQVKINEDPTSKVLRDEGIADALSEYKEAVLDEEKLLRQKTKITWLKEGDKNSAYFHKVLKGRLNRNKIMSICVEDGKRYDNCDVAKHLDNDTKSDISNIFPFKEGKLPVRYLGVLLVTKKIGVADCKQLVDRVNRKINDWKNKSLSYAGRAQLIAFVLGSMQVYWGSVFLLPKTVVNEIEKMFKRFLWNCGESYKGKAKVAWK
ncbi:RNA-directed DNA polymerase, eukaryota, reverse transcriptase zinc-binding domain protein [Tanacetum coccineum]|uniref:RNA-directed DNA polymerase, eukaryota, reverse transcriptase zinc-binding domain protein n=1 Tax=Tanacetum coccineum TaxID=301880 RepID=A0ABQ5F0D3_9ASTR